MTADHQEDNSIDTNLGNEEPTFRTPKVKNFRTLQDDLLHAAQKNDFSKAKVVLSAHEKKWEERAMKETFRDSVVEQKKKRLILQTVCITLVFITSFFLTKIFIHSNFVSSSTQKTEVIQKISFQPTKEVFFDVSHETKDSFEKQFKKTTFKIAPQQGSLIRVVLLKENRPASVSEFLDLWATYKVTAQNVSVFKDDYSLGLYSSEGKIVTFILFTFDEKQNVDETMLLWESKLYSDTRILFTKTKTITTSLFKDAIISDTKLRVLEFGKQDPAVLYSKLDNNTLIITEDAATLELFLKK
jgi:hypothetical protein